MNRPSRLAALIAALAATACLNDAPSGTHPTATTLGITTQISGDEAPVTLDIKVFADSFVDVGTQAMRSMPLTQPGSTVLIGSGHFTLDQGQHRLPVTVDLGLCLGLEAGSASEGEPFCVVRVAMELSSGGIIVDSAITQRFTIRPGETPETEVIDLVGGHVAPAIDSVGQAVAVSFSLVRFELGAHDKNHDLLNVEGTVIDTAGGIDGDGLAQVGPASNTEGIFYAPLRRGFRPQTLEARVFDATGDSAAPLARAITLPSTDAYTACCMSSTVNATTVDVSVAVFTRTQAPTTGHLELLFKNVNSDFVFPDTIYFTCVVPLNPQNLTTATCAKQSQFESARIIAIPVDDAGNAGFVAECNAGDDCNQGDSFLHIPVEAGVRAAQSTTLRSPSIFRSTANSPVVAGRNIKRGGR